VTATVPAAAVLGPPPHRLPRGSTVTQRGRTTLVVLVAVAGLVGVAGGLFFAASAGDVEGAGLALLYALIPLPLLWWTFWWLDRYEPEPLRYKLAAFVWGGVVSVVVALGLQLLVEAWFDLSTEQLATYVAPATEEPAKALFLLLTFLRWRRIIDGFVDGLVVAGIVGIGFAFMENIGYYAISYLGEADSLGPTGASGAAATFFVRGVVSPFAHPLFTSAVGVALGLAVGRRSKVAKVGLVVAGLAVAMLLHGLWNGSASSGRPELFVLTYVLLGVLLVAVGVLAVVARYAQVRTLERSLAQVARRGWIHPDEVPYLSRFTYRKAARTYAAAHYGDATAKAVRRYQELATEMAFLHDAVMRGRHKPHGVERTYGLLDAMHAVRPWVRLPPPLRAPRHLP
jgi:RsiW-degrading membrane proteinase PrsW (M82 family)